MVETLTPTYLYPSQAHSRQGTTRRMYLSSGAYLFDEALVHAHVSHWGCLYEARIHKQSDVSGTAHTMGILGHSEPYFGHMHSNFFGDPLKGLPMHAPHESDADEVNPLAVSLH